MFFSLTGYKRARIFKQTSLLLVNPDG